MKLKVPNMACGACGQTITEAVHSVDPTAEVQADPKSKLVKVESQAKESSIREAIAAAGYPAA